MEVVSPSSNEFVGEVVKPPTTNTAKDRRHDDDDDVGSAMTKVTDPSMDATETTVDASHSSYDGDQLMQLQLTSNDAAVDETTIVEAQTKDEVKEVPPPSTVIIPKLDYESIPSFDTFTDLTNDDHYIRLPRNWHVIVADIEGSTRMIEQGRYRDVNTIGVSCIAAVRNALMTLLQKASSTSSSSTTTQESNATKKFNNDFPYVFGGDGASIVVSPDQFDVACDALRAVQTLAYNNYDGMNLRIGSIPISTLEDQGKVVVEVARYEIADQMCIACFRGGGLALADTWIKAGQGQIEQLPDYLSEEEEDEDEDEYEEYETDDDDEEIDSEDEEEDEEEEDDPSPKRRQPEANLDGLSCRWKKIPSKNGCVLSVLIMHNEDVYSNDFLSRRDMEALTDEEGDDTENPPPENEKPSSSQIYRKVLMKLGDILAPQNSLSKANPVNLEAATYKSAGEMIDDENRMHTNRKRSFGFWTGRAVEIGLCHVIFKMKQLQTAIIDAPAYTRAMRTHADHCKFDDMIRMVLDCTPDQADAIEKYLNGLHKKGRQIFYGLQRSKNTLMTCLLEDTNDGNHIHFVDGDLGGYAVAAKDLKLQLGNYALAKRGMNNVRLDLLKKQHSQRKKGKKGGGSGKKKLRKTVTH